MLSFQLCSGFKSGDPFPQCAHWGLPLKGAAPCGARESWSTPLAPLLGELASDSETEGSPWLRNCQWGKEWSVLRSVFSTLLYSLLWRPLRRFAPLPLRGAAPCGAGVRGRGMRIPTTSLRTGLGMTVVGGGWLRRFLLRTMLKSARRLK